MNVLKIIKIWGIYRIKRYIKNKRENILGDGLGGNCITKVCVVVKGK